MLDVWLTWSPPALTGWLCERERARSRRFVRESLRARFIGAHAFKRCVMSDYVPAVEPSAWRYAEGVYGKPEATAPFPYRFNLSHCGAAVAVAIASGEVGVDIECHRPVAMAATLAERVFHRGERQWLARQASFDAAFFRLWTLKEALLKAAGMGFRFPPEQVGWQALDAPLAHVCFHGRRWAGIGHRLEGATLAVVVPYEEGTAGARLLQTRMRVPAAGAGDLPACARLAAVAAPVGIGGGVGGRIGDTSGFLNQEHPA
ncbi:4'-phosphopantetheinyl transferase family protein [Cupriavidus consociatus]|uniref:4'-phosphopantetheinyl transferase family protein n=1 Tax=Cupriavidus consociatus TaxID=2821357 RepID=UPI001AE91D85|nr:MULTISPECIES: 4'-phosphopantetheinyl transferase superfamily protein [unclassified Cupriavidus]MBP0624094.1 4'-phosphopantetheinyl transferase superfamily protein [Cupriavidus sp. LEh25]MDK2660803.1 4'-phosphopantetheinyl transferase superfamily protein [Cupriavidus sp. LEh21]